MIKCPRCGIPMIHKMLGFKYNFASETLVILTADTIIECKNCGLKHSYTITKSVNME